MLKSKQELVLNNMGLVGHTLKKYFKFSSEDYDEYFQEGLLGLVLAANSYDDSKGFQFSTYACRCIYFQVLNHIYDREKLIRVPRNLQPLLGKLEILKDKNLSIKELSTELGVKEDVLIDFMAARNVTSLQEEVQRDNEYSSSLEDTISDYVDRYEDMLVCSSFDKAISNVSQKLTISSHREVWEDWVESTLLGKKSNQRELATRYGLSQSYISRILRNCKKELKKELQKFEIFV